MAALNEAQLRTTITGLDRRTNSKNGNPRYTVHTADGSFPTGEDSQVGYTISESWIGKRVELRFTNGAVTRASQEDDE